MWLSSPAVSLRLRKLTGGWPERASPLAGREGRVLVSSVVRDVPSSGRRPVSGQQAFSHVTELETEMVVRSVTLSWLLFVLEVNVPREASLSRTLVAVAEPEFYEFMVWVVTPLSPRQHRVPDLCD